jgi:hypothetical protein
MALAVSSTAFSLLVWSALFCKGGYASIPLSSQIETPITIPVNSTFRPSSVFLPLDTFTTANVTNAPSQIHLTLASATGVFFQWATGSAKTGTGYLAPNDPTAVASVVQFGTTAANLTGLATGTAKTYTYNYNTTYAFQGNNTLNYTSPVLHSVTASGLKPGTQYFYRVGDGTAFSGILNFTLPAIGAYPLRIIAVADWGLSSNSSSTLAHILASINAVNGSAIGQYIGDFCYADTWFSNGSVSAPNTAYEGVPNSGTWQPVWDAWMEFIQPFASQVLINSAVGNHEEEQLADGSLFKSVQSRWNVPLASSYSDNYNFHSINAGPVHSIYMSPYTDYTFGSQQYMWLINDLQNVNRSVTPWITVNMHHPWVTTDSSYKEYEQMRTILEPITYRYGVDVFFYGHVHSYERTAPMYNWTVDPCGAVHITIGDAGNSEGLSGVVSSAGVEQDHVYEDYNGGCPNVTTPYPSYMNVVRPVTFPYNYYERVLTFQADGNSTGVGNPPGYCYKEQPGWSQYRESSFGHGTLDFINTTHALWNWHRNQDGLAVATDTIWIVRNTTCPSRTPAAGSPVTSASVQG